MLKHSQTKTKSFNNSLNKTTFYEKRINLESEILF